MIGLLAFLAWTPTADPARILFAEGRWAAIGFGSRCEARTKSLSAKPGSLPHAGFAFDARGARQGQFYARLSRPARSGASVVATIGGRPFLLAGRGQWAWSKDPRQGLAMIDAARYSSAMRIESRDRSGRRIVDRYALEGAATAIDSAAAACAKAGKSG